MTRLNVRNEAALMNLYSDCGPGAFKPGSARRTIPLLQMLVLGRDLSYLRSHPGKANDGRAGRGSKAPKRISLALSGCFWKHLPYIAILLAHRMASFLRSTRHGYIANSSLAGFMLDLHGLQDITLNTTTKVHLKATRCLYFCSSPLFELSISFFDNQVLSS